MDRSDYQAGLTKAVRAAGWAAIHNGEMSAPARRAEARVRRLQQQWINARVEAGDAREIEPAEG